jgi:uncharacterized protein (DUF3084 family)
VKRLTFIDHRGWYSRSGEECSEVRERGAHVERLSAYEDTGLTPEQVAAVVKERDDIKAEFEAWKSGKLGVEEYYALKVRLAEVAAQRDELRAKCEKMQDVLKSLAAYTETIGVNRRRIYIEMSNDLYDDLIRFEGDKA